jgi:hypothetical protein
MEKSSIAKILELFFFSSLRIDIGIIEYELALFSLPCCSA